MMRPINHRLPRPLLWFRPRQSGIRRCLFRTGMTFERTRHYSEKYFRADVAFELAGADRTVH